MKNLILNFEKEVLPEESMRNVKGGNPPFPGGGDDTKTAYITCKNGTTILGELEFADHDCSEALCDCEVNYPSTTTAVCFVL